MKVINEIEKATFIFSDLADGCLYRENRDGPVFMKVSLIKDRVGATWNAINVEDGSHDCTSENEAIFPVNGVFVENYNEKG